MPYSPVGRHHGGTAAGVAACCRPVTSQPAAGADATDVTCDISVAQLASGTRSERIGMTLTRRAVVVLELLSWPSASLADALLAASLVLGFRPTLPFARPLAAARRRRRRRLSKDVASELVPLVVTVSRRDTLPTSRNGSLDGHPAAANQWGVVSIVVARDIRRQ